MVDPIEVPAQGNDSESDGDPSSSEAPPQGARKIISRIIDIALWLAVLGVLSLALFPKKSGPEIGRDAVAHVLPVVGDASASSRTIPGKLERPLLIEAFASWCGACQRTSGILSDLKGAQDEGKLDVVAVSVDDNIQKALSAKNGWQIPVDVLHDESGKFARDYRVDVLPTFILVGVDGTVKRVTSGSPGASDIRAWLRESDED
jgi:thiol-disulfide isomerase/thioredoxin